MHIATDTSTTAAFIFLGLGSLLLLSACGGGGGSDSGTSSGGSPGRGDGGTGQLTLAWTSNATNADGSCSDGIRGYRINLGLTSGMYDRSAYVTSAQVNCSAISSGVCGEVSRCRYTVSGLTQASWHVTLQAVDVNGYQSAHSDEIIAPVF